MDSRLPEDIIFSCPCGARLTAPKRRAGTKLKCPKCNQKLRVPTEADLLEQLAGGKARTRGKVEASQVDDQEELDPSETGTAPYAAQQEDPSPAEPPPPAAPTSAPTTAPTSAPTSAPQAKAPAAPSSAPSSAPTLASPTAPETDAPPPPSSPVPAPVSAPEAGLPPPPPSPAPPPAPAPPVPVPVPAPEAGALPPPPPSPPPLPSAPATEPGVAPPKAPIPPGMPQEPQAQRRFEGVRVWEQEPIVLDDMARHAPVLMQMLCDAFLSRQIPDGEMMLCSVKVRGQTRNYLIASWGRSLAYVYVTQVGRDLYVSWAGHFKGRWSLLKLLLLPLSLPYAVLRWVVHRVNVLDGMRQPPDEFEQEDIARFAASIDYWARHALGDLCESTGMDDESRQRRLGASTVTFTPAFKKA